jgi:hypothetical protein
MKEEERMTFWTLGSAVTDDPKQLVDWVGSLSPWMGGDDGISADFDAETLLAVGEAIDANNEIAEKDEDPDAKQVRLIGLAKQNTIVSEQVRLAELRSELELLEVKYCELNEKEESLRSKALADSAEHFNKLAASVQDRIDILEQGLNELKAVLDVSLPAICEAQAVHADKNSSPLKLPLGRVGPHNGRDAALSLAWIDAHGSQLLDAKKQLRSGGAAQYAVDNKNFVILLHMHFRNIINELSSLRQMVLGAKVMALVPSPTHKKLLNLCYNWLSTFLPHCLAKVNRVSFGLLSAEDCKAALAQDQHVPRSRLKLGVPFMGKDVPSKSSEFAHPDVIIGLTVLAYRYSGLRKDDFIDIIDTLTAQFSHEIGPARDRDSNCRHESWVYAAGGSIRGVPATREGKPWASSLGAEHDASKEVVQLKFLQKSNEEQMEKLYQLIKLEPLVIHYYLQRSIFPNYMRSQRVKLSASGQAVGGDMLVGKRVGFSGTPSDLLPEELGRCDYEKGDDGMMLTTVLDRKVASYEYLQVANTLLMKRAAYS